MTRTCLTLFDPALMKPAVPHAIGKLDARLQWRTPVMVVVYVGSAFTTALAAASPERFASADAPWLLAPGIRAGRKRHGKILR